MFDTKIIDDMAKKLGECLPPGLQNIKQDLEKNFYSVLQGIFAKLDLVTREEFDAQKGVLAKTRSKIENLEKQLLELEQQISNKEIK